MLFHLEVCFGLTILFLISTFANLAIIFRLPKVLMINFQYYNIYTFILLLKQRFKYQIGTAIPIYDKQAFQSS